MTTTLASLRIDPTSHGFISADLLLASKLTALYEYAKSLEERVKELEATDDLCQLCTNAGTQCKGCGCSGE